MLAHPLELLARHDGRAVGGDPDSARDLGGRRPEVAGHDDDPDAGLMAQAHGLGDLGAWRVEERDEAEQAQLALGILASLRGLLGGREPASCDREHAQPLGRVALENGQDLGSVRVRQRDVVVRAADQRRARQHLLGGALRVDGEAPVLRSSTVDMSRNVGSKR